MDCTANLIKTKAKISITNSSIVKNGNLNNSSSTLDFCGYVVANLSANTIAKILLVVAIVQLLIM